MTTPMPPADLKAGELVLDTRNGKRGTVVDSVVRPGTVAVRWDDDGMTTAPTHTTVRANNRQLAIRHVVDATTHFAHPDCRMTGAARVLNRFNQVLHSGSAALKDFRAAVEEFAQAIEEEEGEI